MLSATSTRPISVTRALLDQLTPRSGAFVEWARKNLPTWYVDIIDGKWCAVHVDRLAHPVCITAAHLTDEEQEARARAVADALNRVYAL